MSFPEFFDAFPGIVLPFDEKVVLTRVIRSDAGLVVFFTFLQELTIPMHAHGAQWGTVVEGEIALTIGDETRTYGPGDSYSIPAGVLHGGVIRQGTRAIDVFAEADRYALKT